ncbi:MULTISPECIES: SMC-Scp complex subunit ScpB [Rothia]|mgnify:FL=1|jgi:segregation and condensation protein B|uniref:Segregation and condensation protein B n=1 Tax=Rothia aeria TaxID=172042 RepID=A0A2Z5QYU7_9MICC|nr:MULTISPECIES: SMC-Scp complex subunit ScpB [Rothia]MBF1647308.1 SMC-Scp complex subunit ScpB [Rothia dentocariosa]MDK7676966.1 SMC-Scp complex subunit ScpB [Rothia aeria]QQT89552.1 SMC-Scp complex subunit ScpB [Rothia aeria]QXW93015.1 SMC-Scp complex subunit ScpB [Rothia aeria]RUP73843.1 SMC-Scp complex subunit ScpB [Rothia sp. HSID18069]
MNTSATGGNRFEDEFTESDLNIVNLGYWDPGSDTEIAPDIEQEGTASGADAPEPNNTVETPPQSKGLTVSSLPDKDANKTPSGQRAPRRPSGRTMGAAAVDAEDEFSRVERIPGGVKAAIEAVLAVADAPVSVRELSAALIVNERAVEAALDELYREYNGDESDYGDDGPSREPRGFELRRVGGGWRLYSRADFAPWVARFVTRSQSATLSKSAFETLAVIAYQQPVTRARVAAVRGVNADAAVRQLVHRQLVREAGKEEGTGAALYETTELLLAKLGLDSLDELPELAPFLPDDTEAALLADDA